MAASKGISLAHAHKYNVGVGGADCVCMVNVTDAYGGRQSVRSFGGGGVM